MPPPENPFARKQPWRSRGKGPGGRNLCHCGCGREVQPPRRTAFSDECVTEYKRRNDPATIRRIVHARDHGVCALCGVDTEFQSRQRADTENLYRWLAKREAERLRDAGELPDYSGQPVHRYGSVWSESARMLDRWLRDLGWGQTGHCWEADHIIPVVEGGGGCGPEGYRTLCLPCHRLQTKLLAGRRAAARKKTLTTG